MIYAPTSRRVLDCIIAEDGDMLFVCLESLRFTIEGRRYKLPYRYLSDGYSIPSLFKPLFRKLFLRMPLLIFAALFHDWTNDIDSDYEGDRWQSDADFKRLMKHYKMPFIWRQLFYAGVRAGSWKVWKTQNIKTQPKKI